MKHSKNAAIFTIRAADAAFAAGDDTTARRLYSDAAYQARQLGDLDTATMAAERARGVQVAS